VVLVMGAAGEMVNYGVGHLSLPPIGFRARADLSAVLQSNRRTALRPYWHG
jgi:hypothetical protein